MPKPAYEQLPSHPAARHLRPGSLATYRAPVRNRWAAAFLSVSVGVSFFFMGALFDIILQQHGLGSPAIWLGDLLAGAVAGLLVLFYERRRHRELIRELEIIRLMNHHVRNSLQVIAYASSSEDRAVHVQKVRQAIERIDWALREVLPGRVPGNQQEVRPPE
jgi:hypothetical protein